MALEADQDTLEWITALRATHADDLPLPDVDHALRCAHFAATLFDSLAPTLGLPSHVRTVAIAAALWHDVGYARDGRDHARKSYDMLSSVHLAEFTDAQKMMVACAARYHRRPLPNIEHAGFGMLPSEEQRQVRRLSAIVRIAVALDASHLGKISEIDVQVLEGGVRLIAHALSDAEVERDRLIENAAAFRQLTYVPIEFDIAVKRRPRVE